MICPKCKEESPRKEWKDDGDGMCSEGCCDVKICPKCGRSIIFECGD
jgi:hypothetical protein